MVDLGLLTGDLDGLIETEAYRKYYMHNIGHYLGIDVHDVGAYYRSHDEPVPFEPGVVLTVEPGLYIPADDPDAPEAFRGIGVRIEDDVVVTGGSPEILTDGVPRTVTEIEALRAESLAGSTD
jgi:Xaa-Pro aminopeptidase